MHVITSHVWVTDSSHPTSDGVVIYQRCGCHAHRILIADAAQSSPQRPIAVFGPHDGPSDADGHDGDLPAGYLVVPQRDKPLCAAPYVE